MSSIFRQSVGASLALHAAALLAQSKKQLRTAEMSRRLGVSEAHLSKILQRLFRAGLVRGKRGPGGGFELSRPADEITLREIYEAVEGPIDEDLCPFDVPICTGGSCDLGDEFKNAAARLVEHMSTRKLSEYRPSFFAGNTPEES